MVEYKASRGRDGARLWSQPDYPKNQAGPYTGSMASGAAPHGLMLYEGAGDMAREEQGCEGMSSHDLFACLLHQSDRTKQRMQLAV